MKVPLLDLRAQYAPLRSELLEAVTRVCDSQLFILGPEVEALEHDLATRLEVDHAIAVSSGTDAILAVLMALGIGPGDEVITSTYSFFATAGCVARVGATSVLVDIAPDTFNIATDAVKAAITPRTRAIMPVHLFGLCADMDPIVEAAGRRIPVIEDACQAIGARYRGRQAGSMGRAACFSFFPTKNLGGFGDGGLVTTRDDALAETLLRLRNHGMHPRYYHSMVGGNFRMDALQCALLRVKLRHIKDYAAGRTRNAEYYLSRISELPGAVKAVESDCCCPAEQKAGLDQAGARFVLPVAYGHNGHVWNQFTLRVPGEGRRDALRAHLTEKGIGCEIYYPVPMHRQECFASLPAHALSGCPVSDLLSSEVISIPVYPELTTAQLDEVVAALASFPN
jgi:dTDP-4-amino-4,6-dideoxygalactose transaminase